MSRIVAFRESVMEYIRQSVEGIREVDWYEGLFTYEDVKQWSMRTPCAWVSVTSVPSQHHVTGEINTDLRVVVALIDVDRRNPRDADARVWGLMEDLAVKANMNTFGDENAAPATAFKLLRISDDELRQEGLALGVVEWRSGLTIGSNRARTRDELWIDGRRQDVKMPSSFRGRGRLHDGERETVELDGDGYSGDRVREPGVSEFPIIPGQRREPNR